MNIDQAIALCHHDSGQTKAEWKEAAFVATAEVMRLRSDTHKMRRTMEQVLIDLALMFSLPMERPICASNARHGFMELRPFQRQTKEQLWCGTWYDCQDPGCKSSTLFPSKDLEQHLASMSANAFSASPAPQPSIPKGENS